MAYFSNGSEGADYEDKYCLRCIHFGPDEGPGCPVWGAHHLYNYDADEQARTILNWLIPEDKDGFAAQCRMFVAKASVTAAECKHGIHPEQPQLLPHGMLKQEAAK